MMKYAFYCMLKALFILKIFKFLSDFFDHVRKLLDKKVKNFAQYVAESSSRPFYKKKINLVDLWIDSRKCYKFVFIPCPSQGPPNISKKLTTFFRNQKEV